LLTGDARGDHILESLEDSPRLLTKGKLPVDILKVPHHGSHRNAAVKFFEMIPARHYVISAEGDGKHPNPAQKTLEELFKARPKGPYTIWMTNTPPAGVKAHQTLPPGVKLKITPKSKSSERIHLLDEVTW
jgi:beta-lactamase superfamily II metal-dependent hydrolase